MINNLDKYVIICILQSLLNWHPLILHWSWANHDIVAQLIWKVNSCSVITKNMTDWHNFCSKDKNHRWIKTIWEDLIIYKILLESYRMFCRLCKHLLHSSSIKLQMTLTIFFKKNILHMHKYFKYFNHTKQ